MLDDKKTDEQTMNNAYDKYVELFARDVVEENVHPHLLAAILLKIALQVYRTSFDDEQFNLLVDKIVEDRDLILPFPVPVAAETMN